MSFRTVSNPTAMTSAKQRVTSPGGGSGRPARFLVSESAGRSGGGGRSDAAEAMTYNSRCMTVVKAGMAQVAELAELNRQLIEDERHPDPMAAAQLTERMASWLQDGYVGYVARRAGAAVGYCLYRDAGRYYYLRQLFIARTHRRRGLGTALLDWMYANVWRGKPVRLDVFAHNDQAVAFYRAYGFRVAVLRMEK